MNVLGDEKTFLAKHRLDELEYSRTGLQWESLSNICEAYLKEMPQYRALENYFTDCLKTVDNVHSVVTRLKDPELLIEELIRKKIEQQDLVINSRTYNEIATSLIEIRVLHPFKADWESVHEYITNKWALKEKPIAYVREGDDRESDDRDLLARFENKGCEIRYHELGYRSVNYLAISSIDNRTNYIEIISRTLFEEGWNSIDQAIRSSRAIENPHLMRYLSHFSRRIADMADEMGSFLQVYLNEEQEPAGIEPRIKIMLNDGPKQNVEELRPESKPTSGIDKAILAPENARIENRSLAIADESTVIPLPSFSNVVKKQALQDAKQTDYPMIHSLIVDAQKDPDPKEQDNNSQKFTLSKLKQAIQGITPKNSYQNGQQAKQHSANGWNGK